MSKKMALPEEVLEMVSGGVLTYGDDKVEGFAFYPDGYSITTAKDTIFKGYSADDLAAVKADPSLPTQWAEAMGELYADVKTHRMEDYE